MKLNRTLFWKLFRKSFAAHGAITQRTVDALNAILDKFETETRLKYISWFAYCLATAYHETGIGGNHFVPVKEGKARANTTAWIKYQSKYWGTGYYGRGLVQLTHESNYLKVGQLLGLGDLFVKNPDLVLKIEYAYEAMIIGMVKGIYRSDSKGPHTLSRYLKGDDASVQDYVEAREIINGDKKKNGLMIANYAEKFEHILKDSASDISSAVQKQNDPTDDPPETQNTGADQTSASVEIDGDKIKAETNQPAFVPEEKELQAPVKDGAEAKAAGGTILGIAVPTFVYAAFKGIQEWAEKGFIDVKELLNGVASFISNNTKFVFILIGLVIAVIIVKKVFKQITFIVSMFIAANPNWHNVTVTPAPVEKKAWWKFW